AARDVPARDRPLLSSEPSFGRKANREPGRIGTWAGKREFRKVRRAVENTQSPVPTFGKIRNAHTRPARDLWAIISAMLFFSWQLALIMIAVNAAIGATVGALVVSVIRRSRKTVGVGVGGDIHGRAGLTMGR